MAHNEFGKVFLEIDKSLRWEGDIFGMEWNKVREQQIRFLLERPLMFKVLTEKYWGIWRLQVSFTSEWWEAEQEDRKSNKRYETNELADMALLCLTQDSLNPDLLSSPEKSLLKMAWEDTVKSYCAGLGLNENDLILPCTKKIKINVLRNPREAFGLVPNEEMDISIKRMEHNWVELKKKRDKAPVSIMRYVIDRKNWWKEWLYVDEGGWIREKEIAQSSVVQY